jgi:hypothetical protein
MFLRPSFDLQINTVKKKTIRRIKQNQILHVVTVTLKHFYMLLQRKILHAVTTCWYNDILHVVTTKFYLLKQ